jgi:hypothetical protein
MGHFRGASTTISFGFQIEASIPLIVMLVALANDHLNDERPAGL